MRHIDWQHNQVPSLEYFATVSTTTYVILGSPVMDAGEGAKFDTKTEKITYTRKPAGMVIGWTVLEWDPQMPKVLAGPFFGLQGAMEWAGANIDD